MKQRLLSVVTVVAAATFTFLSLWTWGHGSPVGSSPDEGFHLVSMWCGPDELVVDCKEDPNNPSNFLVPGLMAEPWLCFYGRSEQSAGCQAADIAGRRLSTNGYNTSEYPPYYYDVARNYVSENIESSVLGIRTGNALLGVLILASSLLLHGRRGWILATLMLSLSVPLATFFIPSVNPTGLAITGVAAFALSTSALMRRPQEFRALILPSIVFVVAAVASYVSRRDAVVYSALIGFTALGIDAVSRRGHHATIRRAVIDFFRRPSTLLVGAVSIVLGVAFLASGFGAKITTGLDGNIEARDSLTVLLSNVFDLPTFLGGFFSGPGWGLGWLDTPMPLITPLGASLAALLIFGSLVKSSTFAEKVAFWALLAVIVALVLTTLQADLRYVGETVQPRYLYPLFVSAVLLVASRSDARPRTTMLASTGILLAIAHAVALRTNIRRYTTGLDVRSWRLDEPREWWWSTGPSPSTTWLIGSLSFALAVALCVIGSCLFDPVAKPVSDRVA